MFTEKNKEGEEEEDREEILYGSGIKCMHESSPSVNRNQSKRNFFEKSMVDHFLCLYSLCLCPCFMTFVEEFFFLISCKGEVNKSSEGLSFSLSVFVISTESTFPPPPPLRLIVLPFLGRMRRKLWWWLTSRAAAAILIIGSFFAHFFITQ